MVVNIVFVVEVLTSNSNIALFFGNVWHYCRTGEFVIRNRIKMKHPKKHERCSEVKRSKKFGELSRKGRIRGGVIAILLLLFVTINKLPTGSNRFQT